MAEQPGPIVLALSIPGSGELQAIAGDLAGKLAQYTGGSAGVETSLADAVAQLVHDVSASQDEREVTLEYRSDGDHATVTARSGSRVSEVRMPLRQ